MTEIVRGMAYTIKAYFDPKVTVRAASVWKLLTHRLPLRLACCRCTSGVLY
jgi:hypothetical protein